MGSNKDNENIDTDCSEGNVESDESIIDGEITIENMDTGFEPSHWEGHRQCCFT